MPFGHEWYDLLRDMGSLIGGAFALIAGIAAYIAGQTQAAATQQAADKHIAMSDRKDCLQARCIAVRIYPEILWVKASHERASKIISDEFPKSSAGLAEQLVELIRSASIEATPLINRSLDQLYVLKEVGASVLQLFSVILQYNAMIDGLAERTSQNVNSFDAQAFATNLSGHLSVMAQLLKEVEQKIKPIHDQSTLG
jgi:hypothetical protein